jgi:hypothetical protein
MDTERVEIGWVNNGAPCTFDVDTNTVENLTVSLEFDWY